MIKPLMIALSLQINPVLAANIYSDDKPQNVCVSRAYFKGSSQWDEDSHKDVRLQKTAEFVESNFSVNGFIKLPRYHFFQNNLGDGFFHIYGRLDNNRLTECVAVITKYNSRSLLTRLGNIKDWSANISEEKLWHIKHDADLSTGTFQEGSWNFISNAIHLMNKDEKNYGDSDQDIFLKKIYERIRRKGLENSMHRIVITSHDDASYTFNALFSSMDERGKCIKFINSLF